MATAVLVDEERDIEAVGFGAEVDVGGRSVAELLVKHGRSRHIIYYDPLYLHGQ